MTYIAVPNTETFGLQDVYDSVNSHDSSVAGKLQSCFDKSVYYFFDPNYNKDTYAPANSQKRFRNYFPYSITNWLIRIVINDAADTGKEINSPAYDFTSNEQAGYWYSPSGIILGSTNPAYFYSTDLASSNIASPKRGDTVSMKVQQTGTDSSTFKTFDPTKGHKFWYLISQTEYTSAELSTILANAIEITNISVEFVNPAYFYTGSFYFDISLTQSNYIYMIWDYRE